MAFDMSGMFSQQQQQQSLWAGLASQFNNGQMNGLGSGIGNVNGLGNVGGLGNVNALGNVNGMNGLGMLGNNMLNGHAMAQQMMNTVDMPKAETITGYGDLTWLSAKAGLITCKNKMVISFQLKDFCDQMLNDLTSVLRVGFTLSFQASLNETNEYTATLVQPIYGTEADAVFGNAPEVDLEKSCPTPPNSKDAYSPIIEARAIPALLAIFQRHGLQQIQLSSLHSQMSNCGDDELFRYVGTSSLKRRQFVERRTHIFRLQNDDTIILQNPAIYLVVLRLASFLLRRGGATAIQTLYDFYLSADIPQEIRDQLGDNRPDFLNLILAHAWVFALFPNRTYVSVRRNLPRYDYPAFIKQHFPDLDMLRPQRAMSQGAYGQPRGIQRTMSAHQSMIGGFAQGNQAPARTPTQNPLFLNSGTRPQSLWDSQSSLNQVQYNRGYAYEDEYRGRNGVTPMYNEQQCYYNESVLQSNSSSDQWSPLFSPSTWSSSRGPFGLDSIQSALHTQNIENSVVNHLLGVSTNNKAVVERSMQTEDRSIGRNGCTCQCSCGRSAAGVIGRNSSSRASGGSVSPPSIDSNSPAGYERFSPALAIGSIGSIGDRLTTPIATSSDSSAPSSGPATSTSTSSSSNTRYYDPFGTADLLNGSRLSSLRIN